MYNLDELERLEREATEGPWDYEYDDYDCGRPCTPNGCPGHQVKDAAYLNGPMMAKPNFEAQAAIITADADFITEMRNAAPFVFIRLRALERLCVDLVGEEEMHQAGQYETEMKTLRDELAEAYRLVESAIHQVAPGGSLCPEMYGWLRLNGRQPEVCDEEGCGCDWPSLHEEEKEPFQS